MSSTGNNNNSTKHLHHHFSRSQLEKIINLRINSQQCHDSKCKKEKECFQQALTKMAQTFSEVFALYEKQRIEMHKIYVIHTKICEEFGMPNKITRPTELDEQKLSKIAKRIQEFLVDSNSFKAKTGLQQNATTTAAPTSSTSNNTKVSATEAAPQNEIKSTSSGSKIEVLPISNSNVQSSHNSQLLEMRKRKSTTPATTIPNSDVLMQSTNNSNTTNRFCSGTPQTASNFTASNFHSFNGRSSKSNFSLAPTAQLAHPKPNSGFSAAFPSNCVPLQQQGCLISNGHTLQNKNISVPTAYPLIYQSRELSVDYGNRDICTKRLKLNNQIFKVPAPIPMIDDDVIQID